MSSPIPIPPRKDSWKRDYSEPIDWDAKRTQWSDVEDNMLKQAVAQHGINNWDTVAKMLWTRKDAKQCRARWAELAPMLQAEAPRRGASSGRARRRGRSTTLPAMASSSSGSQRQRKTYFQPSSSAAEMIRQIEAANGEVLHTPPMPIPMRSRRKLRKPLTQPTTPMDSPLLNPDDSPPSRTPPPPSPPPALPPRPLRMLTAPPAIAAPTTTLAKRHPSWLSLLPTVRNRSQSVPTASRPKREGSRRLQDSVPETPESETSEPETVTSETTEDP
ncbi:hypothetical protein GGR53DRAFT_525293 [Hypoxylon sp. FL1150]|nr:hypothetical protein GGR53DRAFT_525293 [Hypoxylon sp. FL1150]